MGWPFLFCRYEFTVEGESLSERAQFEALSELQGQPVAHRRGPDDPGHLDTLVMRPRRLKVLEHNAISWSVGHILEARTIARYDKKVDKLDFQTIADGSVRYSDFIAVPALGALAVDDRSGEMHLGGKQAISRLRSVVRMLDGADISVQFNATPGEVRRALKDWSLTKFSFTVQPNNPRPVGRLGQELSDKMKLDGIGKMVGTAYPAAAAQMQMAKEGFIEGAVQLEEAGYGQIAVSGVASDGVRAEIKKPKFDSNVVKNEQIQAKPRELRVFVDDEDLNQEQAIQTAAMALIRLHGHDEGSETKVPPVLS